jgi:glycine oxidase
MKIVIVGAGIAGLSIGWRLAQSGAEVTVIERSQPGGGATLASAGMIAATAESGDETSAEAKFGRASAALWPAFAAEIEETSGRKIGFRPEGTLLIARTAEENERLAARAGSIPSAKILSPAEACGLEPLLDENILGALLDPNEAQVDNRAIGRALATAFVRAGGSLQTNETIVRIEVAKDGIVGAISPFRHYHADVYILAAGAWTARINGLPPDVLPPVVPMKGEMISLEPKSALPSRMVWGNEVYLVPRNNRLFVGATLSDSGFDTSLTETAEAWLRDHVDAGAGRMAGRRALGGIAPGLARRSAHHWRHCTRRPVRRQRTVPQRYPLCTGHGGSLAQSHSGTPLGYRHRRLRSPPVHQPVICLAEHIGLTRTCAGRS